MKKLIYWLQILIASSTILSACAKEAGHTLVLQESPMTTIKSEISNKIAGSGGYVMMTFNIRQDAPDAGNRAWSVRRSLVKERILEHDCDIVGVQEALGNQMDNMASDLQGYSKVGTGREGNTSSEHSAIFYKNTKFNALESGTFWLAPGTPTTPTGPAWDAAYKRICTWIKLQDKQTAMIFYVFNTHFDHKGVEAKVNSANLLLTYMQNKIGALPAVLMGDLNANQNSAAYNVLNSSLLLEESWAVASSTLPALRVTGNGWNISPTGDSQIDHIFVTSQWKVSSRLVDWYHKDPGEILPSDHFPVVARMNVEGVSIFKDAHYGGKGVFLPKGSYNLADLNARGIENDWASSARVPNGVTLTLYEHQNFSGINWVLTTDTPLFSQLTPTANDKASSMKVE
ncbi:endonuclease/exonuclease/phosphatase family protein [Sphingobacterium siyangense]|uniref:endonuclease/exonuclease/phosphatase family protein n=1 Tax=Sphingobacterium TaxID=28453 RepID=UPI003DA3A5B0